MTQKPSLRERKKFETKCMIRRLAVAMFVDRGFDQVPVAAIADAAGVSKMTVFNYFPAKEDLVMAPVEEHIDDMARAVRERSTGESALDALRQDFVAALDRHDPSTGLNDDAMVLQVRRLVMETPALLRRALVIGLRSEELLTAQLESETGDTSLATRLIAGQISQARRVLVMENVRRLSSGEHIDHVHRDAVTNAHQAFDLLRNGLGEYCVRRGSS